MFTKKPSEHIEDTEGKLVKIEGRVSGSQPMSISWFKDDTEICSSNRYDISFKSNVAVLCIKSSQVSDSGKYVCHASNEAGKVSCDVTVGISGGCFTPCWIHYSRKLICRAETRSRNQWFESFPKLKCYTFSGFLSQ